ncbi:MAG: glycosyltransferase family 2 protein [Anaerolineae bacterium]
MTQPHVIAVILNTNRRADTLACLASLAESDYAHLTVLALDNASTDGSTEAIAAAFPAVQVLPLAQNLGYAGNNNVGIAAALAQGADWLFVLNEDTVQAPDCITKLVALGESDAQIGIVGPLVCHFDEPAVIQSAGGRLSRFWKSLHSGHNEPAHGHPLLAAPRPVDFISGCAILVRRETVEQIGALDERFFYYWEETEWCLRARRNGWQVWFEPAAQLWHKGVQRDYQPNPSVTYYNTRNQFMLLAKHRAPLTVWLVAWVEVARTLTSWTIKPRWRAMRPHRDAMAQGAADFLRKRHGMRPA